ncbi:MAG TPA: PilZ domain-containing protein, partial [Aestuariivirgaceae bacterium]|nr:PilZ domain-containing protein [Aestuariivirgaceae bacterium]
TMQITVTTKARAKASSDADTERRSARRGRVLKSGKLVLNSCQSTIDCVIRDISPLGAHVRLSDAMELPDILQLHVVRDAELHPAKVLWRSRTDCGLVFTGPPKLSRHS